MAIYDVSKQLTCGQLQTCGNASLVTAIELAPWRIAYGKPLDKLKNL